ncbi:hypothetical protein ACTXT7_014069 [Hymenolepis weldensis]
MNFAFKGANKPANIAFMIMLIPLTIVVLFLTALAKSRLLIRKPPLPNHAIPLSCRYTKNVKNVPLINRIKRAMDSCHEKKLNDLDGKQLKRFTELPTRHKSKGTNELLNSTFGLEGFALFRFHDSSPGLQQMFVHGAQCLLTDIKKRRSRCFFLLLTAIERDSIQSINALSHRALGMALSARHNSNPQAIDSA